jgi:Aspartate racemase
MSDAAKPGRCLGLIGGLGPGATIHYYRELIAGHERQRRVPRLLIVHADIQRVYALVIAKDFDGLARYSPASTGNMSAGVLNCVPLSRQHLTSALRSLRRSLHCR